MACDISIYVLNMPILFNMIWRHFCAYELCCIEHVKNNHIHHISYNAYAPVLSHFAVKNADPPIILQSYKCHMYVI